jgi:hypothetical protein
MRLKKINKESKGRMTVREELAGYFSTAWTLDDGAFYLNCVESLPEENKKLIELLLASRKGGTTHE